jgi:putative transposase
MVRNGYRVALAENGIQVGIYRIRRVRKKLGLRCRQKKKFKATTDSRYKLPVTQNLLEHQFKVHEPDKMWWSDIIYMRTDER